MALATVTPSNGVNDAALANFINRRGWPSRANAQRHNKLTLGDLGGAVGRLNEDIATLGAQSRGNSLGESVNTLEDAGTSFDTELELLRCGQPGLNSESFGIDGERDQRSSESHPKVDCIDNVARTLWAKRCCWRFRVERAKGARLEAAERTEVRVDRARCIAKETG